MTYSAKNCASRLILGTAQLGLIYGVANRSGQPDAGMVAEILAQARSAGINTIDTAAAYGDAEKVLGQAGLDGWRVITKLPPMGREEPTFVAENVRNAILASRERLGLRTIHAVLLHDATDATGPAGSTILETMSALRTEGVVEKIGISIYRSDDLEGLSSDHLPQIVQGPLNPLDQRLLSSGAILRLANSGTAFHARSLFLQGLLLMSPQDRPARFAPWADALQRFDSRSVALDIDPLALCIGFALAAPGVDQLVVGVETARQLKDIVSAVARAPAPDLTDLACEDPALLEPRYW